jgi:hypothetical protein
MATKASAKAARERKQKIFIAAGGVVLLLLLAIQLPKLLGGSQPATAGSTETSTVAGETTPDGTTPSSTTPTSTSTSTSIALTDTDRPLPVGPGQFRSFSAFNRKDPFVQGIEDDSPLSGNTPAEGGSGTGTGTTPPKTAPPSQGFSVDGSSAAAVTLISVNGARQALKPGTAFPAADPVFVLVAENAAKKTAVIGVVGGAYASGSRTTRLKVGKPLVLVNTSTGARYRVVLIAVGSGSTLPTAPSAPTSPSAPTTP